MTDCFTFSFGCVQVLLTVYICHAGHLLSVKQRNCPYGGTVTMYLFINCSLWPIVVALQYFFCRLGGDHDGS